MTKFHNAFLVSFGNWAFAWTAIDKKGNWRQAVGIMNERKLKPVIELLLWTD